MLCRRCLPLLHSYCPSMATTTSVAMATTLSATMNPNYLSLISSRHSSTSKNDTADLIEQREERELEGHIEGSGTNRTGFYRPFSCQTITPENVFPHSDLMDKLYHEAEEKEKNYLGLEASALRYDEDEVLKLIRQPKIQDFIDGLQEKYLAELPHRLVDANIQTCDVLQAREYPENLMGLDPFNYIREELAQQKMMEEEYPLGQNRITSGVAVNKLALKTPLDLPYLIKNEGAKTGISQFIKIYFLQGKSSASIKYKSLKNRGFDHETSDGSLRNKTLAAHLQTVYLKHFQLISERRWDVLLDYMAEEKVAEIMTTCANEEDAIVEAWFDVKFVENNKKPKIVSHMELPVGDKKFVQVLVKMNMKVECLHFEEGAEAKVGEQDMIHYVVFEREVNDILSNFRIIDKVREADIEHFKRHELDEDSLQKSAPKLGNMMPE